MNINVFTSAGIFLTKVWLIGSIKDENGLIAIKNDSVGVTIGFATGDDSQHYQHDFWIPSLEYRKLSEALDIVKGHKIGGQLIGKQLWICIREIHTSEDSIPVIRYKPFDWIKCTDPNVRPIISGDPIQHKEGKPLGVFLQKDKVATFNEAMDKVEYGPSDALENTPFCEDIKRKTTEQKSVVLDRNVGVPLDFTPIASIEETVNRIVENVKDKSAEERLSVGKAIIENAKNNKSVETSEENDPWADM